MHRYASTTILAAALLVLSTGVAYAGKTSGCGWGSEIFKGESGTFTNFLAMSTNGIIGNNTIGLTFGTSGCDPDAVVFHIEQQERFALVHMDTLSVEMARGDGEHVRAMASLLGCEASAQAKFGYWAQERHAQLFSAERTQAQTWLRGLKQDLIHEANFRRSCVGLS